MNKTYQAPSLTVEGSVEALTAEQKIAPKKLDKDFPQNTPFRKLTFS